MSRRFEPSQRPTSGDRRGWAALGLLSAAACAPTPELGEGFVPSGSFAAAAQNCAALQAVSDPICGDETFPVHCWWASSYEDAAAFRSVTERPAFTCDAGIGVALRGALEQRVSCEIDEDLIIASIQCSPLDTGGESTCAPTFSCFGVR